MEKTYISANDLLLDSYKLGIKIFDSGFKPDFIVGVWRGGTPVGRKKEWRKRVGIEPTRDV